MKKLLLLHGAIGSQSQLEPLKNELKNDFELFSFNFPGHGGSDLPVAGFSIQLYAESLIQFIDKNKLDGVDIFGYSMGGYVAMYLAKTDPEKIGKVITLATKYHWDEPTAEKEVRMLNAEKIEAKIPAFANELKARHAPQDWKKILKLSGDFMIEMGKNNPLSMEDFKTIQNSVLILLGDRDKMVTIDETIEVYKALPNAQLGILPLTPHPIEQVEVKRLAYYIYNFLK